MRLNGDPSTRDEARGIAVGLVIMDEETDPGRATGYYWWRTTGETETEGGDGWRRGVHDGRGPHASAEAAFRAASRNDAAEMELAWRLDEAASLVRAGHIDPTRESLAAFLEKALEINAERRAADPGTERTARGLFIEDGLRATREAEEAEENAEEEDIWAGTSGIAEPAGAGNDADAGNEAEAPGPQLDENDEDYQRKLGQIESALADDGPDIEIPAEEPAGKAAAGA